MSLESFAKFAGEGRRRDEGEERERDFFRPAGHVPDSNKRSRQRSVRETKFGGHCEGHWADSCFPGSPGASRINKTIPYDLYLWALRHLIAAARARCVRLAIPRRRDDRGFVSRAYETSANSMQEHGISHETSQLISSSFRVSRDSEGALRRERLNWSAIQRLTRLVHSPPSPHVSNTSGKPMKGFTFIILRKWMLMISFIINIYEQWERLFTRRSTLELRHGCFRLR